MTVIFSDSCWRLLCVSFLCVRPAETLGRLSSVSCLCQRLLCCICLCIRPVEAPGSLFFVSLYNSGICYSSKMCHRTVVNISLMPVGHQVSYGHYQGGNYLLYCQVLINLSVVLILLVTPCTRAHVVVTFGCTCQLVFWVRLLHTCWVSMGITFWKFLFKWGSCAQAKKNLWSTPPHSKIHHRDYIEGIPLNAKVGGARQTFDSDSRACSHCTSPEKSVHAGYDSEDRHTGHPMHPRCQMGWYLPANWNSGTSMGVSSRWFLCHV